MTVVAINIGSAKYPGLLTYIDEECLDLVMPFSWYPVSSGNVRQTHYAVAKHRIDGRHTVLPMHRLLLNAPKGMMVDHWNSNGLDNRRCNLRLATCRQNMANKRRSITSKSPYKGVSQTKNERWRAIIETDGCAEYLGTFDTAEEAARIYDARAVELFGEFAYLNFPTNVVPPLPPVDQMRIIERERIPVQDTHFQIVIESDLKQWVMSQGGSAYVKRLLMQERTRVESVTASTEEEPRYIAPITKRINYTG